jgi:hypothetical protein
MMPSAMRSFAYGSPKALREIQSSTQAHAHFLSRRVSDYDIDVTPLTTVPEVTTEHFECSFLDTRTPLPYSPFFVTMPWPPERFGG